jgi:RNA polymerase sigma-70 factor (ECF subfamily)
MTDTALIARYLQGDTQAFNILVWRWEKPIYNFVLRNIGNEESAKDICQTTFIRAFKQLKRLREPEKFSPWLYRIAHNLCCDEYKKKKNRPVYYLNERFSDDETLNPAGQMAEKNSKTPEDLVHHQQIGDILKRALLQLPEEQRVVIIMKQYQELKFTEIADILKQPINTIKSRLYYGLRTLRKILEGSNLNKEVLLHEM